MYHQVSGVFPFSLDWPGDCNGVTGAGSLYRRRILVQTPLGTVMTASGMSSWAGLKISLESLNLCRHLCNMTVACKLLSS